MKTLPTVMCVHKYFFCRKAIFSTLAKNMVLKNFLYPSLFLKHVQAALGETASGTSCFASFCWRTKLSAAFGTKNHIPHSLFTCLSFCHGKRKASCVWQMKWYWKISAMFESDVKISHFSQSPPAHRCGGDGSSSYLKASWSPQEHVFDTAMEM